MTISVPPAWPSVALRLIGFLFLGYSLLTVNGPARPAWVLPVALLSVAALLLRAVLMLFARRPLELWLSVLAALAGGLVAAATYGVAVAAAAIGVMIVVGSIETPILWGVGLALSTMVLIAVGAIPVDTEVLNILVMMAAVVIAAFAGFSRRQFRLAQQQSDLLRERELAVRQERAQIELLNQRQAVARDIHDVLAHSLGGLVIQLDAVEALLEAGRIRCAQERIVQARTLAADGLGEARRAVTALRHPDSTALEPGEPVTAAEFSAAVAELVAAHRVLGGAVEAIETGVPCSLGAAEASAMQRAMQEALSNARKHAPGAAVRVAIRWENDRVRLTVSNPLPARSDTQPDGGSASSSPDSSILASTILASSGLASSGGGHGLSGMRERFAALPSGGAARAAVTGDRFTVEAEVGLHRPRSS